jgi:hypothetical protein
LRSRGQSRRSDKDAEEALSCTKAKIAEAVLVGLAREHLRKQISTLRIESRASPGRESRYAFAARWM